MNLEALESAGAVTIAGPAESTAESVIAALANGKHGLCNPPMALTASDCARMMDAASEHKRILMVRHQLRFHPLYQQLRKFVVEGGRGRILSATFIRQSGPPEPIAGGSLLNLLIDQVDMVLWLFGMPAKVNCKAFAGSETVMAALVYPGGPEVRIQGGWFPGELPLAESFQVRAEYAELNTFKDRLQLNDSTGQRRELEFPRFSPEDALLSYFVGCCQTGQPPLECPPSSSALAVRVALLLKQSRELGGQPLECNF